MRASTRDARAAADSTPRRVALAVRIGPHADGWSSAPREFPAMAEPDRAHTLQVTLVAPTLTQAPVQRRLVLPPSGPSTTTEFSLPVRPGRHQARLVVQHDGRVLQTALVTLAAADSRSALEPLVSIRDEVAVAGDLDDLDWGRSFDLALVANHNPDDEPGVAVLPKDGLPFCSPAGWDGAAKGILGVLTELAEQGPEADGATTEFPRLLAALAHHGHLLRKALFKSAAIERLPADPVVQIVSARPDSWCPAEFLYDGPVPPFTCDVELCQRALELLADPAPASAACDADHGDATVCPLGFWGARTVIERQAHGPAAAASWDWRLTAEAKRDRDALGAPGKAVFAAHRHVDVVRQDASASVLATLADAGVSAAHVGSWDEWVERVREDEPTLLVVLGHNEPRTWGAGSVPLGLSALAIDVGLLDIGLVDRTYIAGAGSVHPIVLLLCCNTANASAPYQGFAATFRDEGAPVVVATLTDILGRYAAPVASAAIEYLTDPANDGVRVGELMLGLRRRMFAERLPIGLALVAYGDADWKLTTAEHRRPDA